MDSLERILLEEVKAESENNNQMLYDEYIQLKSEGVQNQKLAKLGKLLGIC